MVSGSVLAAAVAVGVTTVGLSTTSGADTSPTVSQLDLTGPPDSSERFGEGVIVLANGNYVVTDSGFDLGGEADVGAVHLYDGTDNTIISTLHGTTAGDQVGGPLALPDGDFLVISWNWDLGTTADVGAITWVDGTTGLDGPVTTSNSLHGTSENDQVGQRVVELSDGNQIGRASCRDRV